MSATSLDQLSKRIVDLLAQAGHIDAQRSTTITAQLTNGRMSEEDWRGEIERKLQADQAVAKSPKPSAAK
jgi:hypothetical protein